MKNYKEELFKILSGKVIEVIDLYDKRKIEECKFKISDVTFYKGNRISEEITMHGKTTKKEYDAIPVNNYEEYNKNMDKALKKLVEFFKRDGISVNVEPIEVNDFIIHINEKDL